MKKTAYEKRANGRHDRWSREAAPRAMTFAFVGPSHDGSFARYVAGFNLSTYFGEYAVGRIKLGANFSPARIALALREPLPRGQILFVDDIQLGGISIMQGSDKVPFQVFCGGLDIDPIPLQAGEEISVRVSCELIP